VKYIGNAAGAGCWRVKISPPLRSIEVRLYRPGQVSQTYRFANYVPRFRQRRSASRPHRSRAIAGAGDVCSRWQIGGGRHHK
jgi:hypothetical protein